MATSRRDLIKLTALAAGGLMLGTSSASPEKPASTKPLRLLILGGTGFTGPHQIRYALERGHRITIFNRGKRPATIPEGVEVLLGDRDTGDLASLSGREWDVCIDNPTSVPHWVRDAGKVLAGKVGHYIFISSISVYADATKPGIDEEAPVASYQGEDAMAETMTSLRADMSKYGPLKALSEAEARKQFGEATTIIRPGLIVGPGDETDRFTYWPSRVSEGGEVLAPGDGNDPAQIIDARDLAEWTIRMAESRTRGTFNATGPNHRLSTAAMLHSVRAATSAASNFTWVPSAFLAEHNVSPWSDMPAWVPANGESGGLMQVSNARALAADLRFRPLAVTCADTLDWFNSLPAERRAQPRAGLSRVREAEVLKAWKASRKPA